MIEGFRYIEFIVTEPIGEVGYIDGREIVGFQIEKDIADQGMGALAGAGYQFEQADKLPKHHMDIAHGDHIAAAQVVTLQLPDGMLHFGAVGAGWQEGGTEAFGADSLYIVGRHVQRDN